MRVHRNRVLSLIFYGNSAFNLSTCKHFPISMEYSTVAANPEKLYTKGSVLQGKLERALKEHKVDEAWETYKDFKNLHGYPDQSLMANLITELSYSPDSKYLRRACDLVVSVSKEKKPVLFGPNMMTKLVLSLARAQIPVLASRVLRLMLEKRSLPSLDVLRLIFLHLVKTDFGTFIASNILTEICDCFQMLNVKKSSQTDLTTIFNLVLDGCVRFGSPLKGQQITELMPQLGVLGDAYTVLILSRIHEMNGTRDELKKFKDHVNKVPVTLLGHYQQFYECLLSLHFKFNDIDAASALLLEMCGYCERGKREEQKSFTVSIGSDNIKMGLKLQFLLPSQKLLDKDSVYKVESKQELVLYMNGNFVLSNRGLAKLILGYKRHGRINELSKILISIQNMLSLSFSDVIDACIHLGWLEIAHDILEDLESENYYVTEGSYASLFTAYYKESMFKEAQGLVRHMRKISSKYEYKIALHLKQLTSVSEPDLADSVLQIMKLEDKAVSTLALELNSSIYFFSKAKMVGDAWKTYRKMQVTKLPPNSSTFFYFICGYSSLGMYREITIIWGDIKRSMENQNTIYHRDLYELVILNFIRGGYFERVMEVIGFMMEQHMYLDKWCYRTEFLKFHRDLYRKLTSSDAKDEVQRRRIGHVQAFRKWAGLLITYRRSSERLLSSLILELGRCETKKVVSQSFLLINPFFSRLLAVSES